MPLVLTLMLGVVLAALGSAMAIAAATDTMIAGAHRDGTVLFYAADAAAEFAVEELARSDWPAVLDTGGRSTFFDETPPGSRSLDGPAGYEVYASGPLGGMLGRASSEVDPYVTVWIADLTEPPAGTGSERIAGILATAFGQGGGRRSVVLTARLSLADGEVIVERLSWMPEP